MSEELTGHGVPMDRESKPLSRISRRQLGMATGAAALGLVGSGLFSAPSSARARTERRLVAGYNQITAAGEYVDASRSGAQYALLTYAVIHRVTGDPAHRELLDALIDYTLEANPAHMSTLLGIFTLTDDYLRSRADFRANVAAYATNMVSAFNGNPGEFLHRGVIRQLADNADFLVTYATFLTSAAANSSGRERDDLLREARQVDRVAVAMLDRLVVLQFSVDDATNRFHNPRLTGCFPHNVDSGRGNMGSWDVAAWAFPMLAIDQSPAIRALADGFGRYQASRYQAAAAAGMRPFLATESIAPDLVYAGAPAGFPLDGADFEIEDESGEFPYLITYGWSPNGIGDLGWAARAFLDHGVVVPRSATWAERYWLGTPSEVVLNPQRFRAGLAAKLDYAQDFIKATQLPVPVDFPWLGLERSNFPGAGDDALRRGGWYDGSGRGDMSVWYAQIAIRGYVASGGDDKALLTNAADWWEQLLVWEG